MFIASLSIQIRRAGVQKKWQMIYIEVHAVGTPVFGGMIAAFVFGIFIIPLLYITAERLRGRMRPTDV